MAAVSLQAKSTVVFKSKADLEKAFEPLSIEEVSQRISASTASISLDFQYDEGLTVSKSIPLRNRGSGNLLKTEVYKTKSLTVFYPETPRVPQHLTIALNRKDIRGIASVSEEENAELFATIRKIAEIYKSISITGFVVAQYDTPQEGHFGRYVVEIIPHLPGFHDIKNTVDKADSNRHVLFRTANFSPIKYKIKEDEILQQANFWKSAFQVDHPLLDEEDTKIVFPYSRKESHHLECEEILHHQLLEILQDNGGRVLNSSPFEAVMPTQIPEAVKSVTATKCLFCDDAVIKRQIVYQYEDVSVFYNMRKGAKAGSCFLILPNRHTEKVYRLNSSEIHNISVIRKVLVEVLKETHPEYEVIVYIQDDPSIGQTVFHSHEQVVAVDPKTIALTWTMATLYPSSNVSDEEMLTVREEFRLKLEQKIKEAAEFEETA